MIWRLISNHWYSILINWVSFVYFTSNRGLRQEDPLSPFLYIIALEVLSPGLSKLHAKYPSIRYYCSAKCPTISHLSYGDDIIIFCNEGSNSLKTPMEFLRKIHKFTCLEIKSKSCFVNLWSNGQRDSIAKSITGFSKKSLPLEYLGCPLFRGIIKSELFLTLVKKLLVFTFGWVWKAYALFFCWH